MEKFLETEWSGRVVGGEHAGRQKSGHGEGLWWCVGEVASMGEETAMVVRVFGQVGKHGRAGEQAVRFVGYLGWLGASVNTIRQNIYAIKMAHKRVGAGDVLDGMHRVWILLGGLDRRSTTRRPPRLGVTQ